MYIITRVCWKYIPVIIHLRKWPQILRFRCIIYHNRVNYRRARTILPVLSECVRSHWYPSGQARNEINQERAQDCSEGAWKIKERNKLSRNHRKNLLNVQYPDIFHAKVREIRQREWDIELEGPEAQRGRWMDGSRRAVAGAPSNERNEKKGCAAYGPR